MALKTRERKSRQLTPESFERLLAQLDADPGLAGVRYERLRDRLVVFFLRRMSTAPEHLADEVIDRLAARLFEGEAIGSIEAYALGVARHVAQEQVLRTARESSPEKQFFENISGPDPTHDDEAAVQDLQLDTMEACLATLPREDLELLTRYYILERKDKIETRRALAAQTNMTQAALRKRIFLIAGQLRACVQARIGQ